MTVTAVTAPVTDVPLLPPAPETDTEKLPVPWWRSDMMLIVLGTLMFACVLMMANTEYVAHQRLNLLSKKVVEAERGLVELFKKDELERNELDRMRELADHHWTSSYENHTVMYNDTLMYNYTVTNFNNFNFTNFTQF